MIAAPRTVLLSFLNYNTIPRFGHPRHVLEIFYVGTDGCVLSQVGKDVKKSSLPFYHIFFWNRERKNLLLDIARGGERVCKASVSNG